MTYTEEAPEVLADECTGCGTVFPHNGEASRDVLCGDCYDAEAVAEVLANECVACGQQAVEFGGIVGNGVICASCAYLEAEAEDSFYAELEAEWDDWQAQFDDDPSPYSGDYSEM